VIWLAHLFRRNHDARRARWFVFGACAGSLVIAVAYDTTRPACAADAATCAAYGVQVERLVKLLTNDDDVAQAARDRGEVHCGVIDYPVRLQLDPEEGTAPAMGPTVSPKDKWCRAHYRSYRPADGTVLRGGNRKRVACPWPGGNQ